MYQMISYAYRRGTNKVLLIYPNTSDKLADDSVFLINKGTKDETIKITAAVYLFGHLMVTHLLKRI